jgi:tol-pal system protein YbgF
MKRVLVLVSVLLVASGFGCTNQEELNALRAEVTALERQLGPRGRDADGRLNSLGEQVARLEQSQTDVRRELAQTKSATEDLRVNLQRVRGELQEAQNRMQRRPEAPAEGRNTFAGKLAELETRLAELEGRQSPEKSTAPTPPALLAPPSQPPTPPTSRPPATAQPAPPAGAPSDAVATKPPTAPTTRPPTTTQPTPPAGTSSEGETADRLHKRAMQEYQQGNYERAMVLFKQFLNQYPKAPQAGSSQYWIGESLYAQKQYEAAIVAFDEVIRKYPEDAKTPAALLKQGYAFAELKDLRNARFFLQQVQKKYPNTPEAKQAEERLKQLQRQG